MDAVWVDFSEFGTGDISLNNTSIEVSEGIYDDIWLGTVGYVFPADENNVIYKVGFMHVTSLVDDEHRTLSFSMDRIWGVGAGASLVREGHRWDINTNIYDLGEAPIDTGDNLFRGRVVGKTKNPYAIALDIAYHW